MSERVSKEKYLAMRDKILEALSSDEHFENDLFDQGAILVQLAGMIVGDNAGNPSRWISEYIRLFMHAVNKFNPEFRATVDVTTHEDEPA